MAWLGMARLANPPTSATDSPAKVRRRERRPAAVLSTIWAVSACEVAPASRLLMTAALWIRPGSALKTEASSDSVRALVELTTGTVTEERVPPKWTRPLFTVVGPANEASSAT